MEFKPEDHQGDPATDWQCTKQLLMRDYKAADEELKAITTMEGYKQNKEKTVAFNKMLKESRTKRDKLKNQILELVMQGQLERAGSTKPDKKPKRSTKWDVTASDEEEQRKKEAMFTVHRPDPIKDGVQESYI